MDDMLLFRGVPMPKNYSSLGIARKMTDALTRHGASDVYAFSNTAPAEDDPELLRVFDHWVEEGHHVANHTHHHASINWVDAATYIGDIERTETIIARWASQAPRRYFRYCNDMWGDTEEKQAAVGAYLARHGLHAGPRERRLSRHALPPRLLAHAESRRPRRARVPAARVRQRRAARTAACTPRTGARSSGAIRCISG
jgi:peptidoglycan/xylan/chitin deacetylase (PgdA/CDA1 family)